MIVRKNFSGIVWTGLDCGRLLCPRCSGELQEGCECGAYGQRLVLSLPWLYCSSLLWSLLLLLCLPDTCYALGHALVPWPKRDSSHRRA